MAASPWLSETGMDPTLPSTVWPWPLHPTGQFSPLSSQTEAVSAHRPLPDKPGGQTPLHQQTLLAEDEALDWPQATVGPAWSWAEQSSLSDVLRSQSSL